MKYSSSASRLRIWSSFVSVRPFSRADCLIEEGYAEQRRTEIELPEPVEQQLGPDPQKGEAPPLRPAS